MLSFYHRLAVRLYRYRRLLGWLCAASIVGFAVTVLFSNGTLDEVYTLGAVTAVMWTSCALAVAYNFVTPAPSVPLEAGWLARLRARLRRGSLWLLALLMSAVSGAVVIMTLRAVAVLLRALDS